MARRHARAPTDALFDVLAKALGRHLEAGQHLTGERLGLGGEGDEQVLGADVPVIEAPRLFLRDDHHVPGSIGESLEHVPDGIGPRATFRRVRLVIARCTVDYEGRLAAHLPSAIRLILVKADGCVAVHADGGAYKPLNWMNAPNTRREAADQWVVTNPAGERLVITLEDVLSDVTHELGPDPGLSKDGVEAHLQELLAASPHVLGDGLVLVRREYPTDIGPVDLLCRDADGRAIAIEVKRRGEIDGVEQLARYVERLDRDSTLRPVVGMFVAQVVRPQARTLAEARGLVWREVDYDELRGLAPDRLRLF